MNGLSDQEWSDVLAVLPESPEAAAGWELSLVRRTVERVVRERMAADWAEAYMHLFTAAQGVVSLDDNPYGAAASQSGRDQRGLSG